MKVSLPFKISFKIPELTFQDMLPEIGGCTVQNILPESQCISFKMSYLI